MEDAHVLKVGVGGFSELGLFGVFDGHGGDGVANHVASGALAAELVATAEFQALAASSESESSSPSESDRGCAGAESAAALAKGLRSAFLSLDAALAASASPGPARASCLSCARRRGRFDAQGTTAVLCLVTPSHYVIANCGDSRLLVCTAGEDGRAFARFSTRDHKPTLPEERDRVVNAGGTVTYPDGRRRPARVNRDLSVSRALGDFAHKRRSRLLATEQAISAEPDVSVVERRDSDKCVIAASDGVWDVSGNAATCQDVCAAIEASDNSDSETSTSLDEVCQGFVKSCIARGSQDNATIVVVAMARATDASSNDSKE